MSGQPLTAPAGPAPKPSATTAAGPSASASALARGATDSASVTSNF